MRNIVGLIGLLLVLILVGCDDTSGTIQSEDTGVATLVDELGNPVSNASVRVFTYRDSTGIYEDSISTNERGEYSFSYKLDAGRYTIWAETDTSVLYREDLIITPDSLFQDQDTLKPSRSIVVPVKVQPNHNPQTVEVQIWGTPIRHNVTADGHLVLDKIPNGTYFTRLTTTLIGYTPTNDTIFIDDSSIDAFPTLPDTLKDTLELIYTGIPVVSGLTYTYDTLNTTVNLSWDQTSFNDIQAYVIERKLKNETVWPTTPLQLVYVNQTSHPVTYSDVVSVGNSGAVYQYRIKIIDNSSLSGVPFGVLEVNAVSASNATTTITASSMQKAKGIIGNRASINDVMSFTVNFSNPSRKLTKIDWFEGTTLLKTTPLTELIVSDSFEKSWTTVGAKSLTVHITDDAGKVWEKVIPVSIVEDKPVISFVDTTINLNVLDTLTAVVSDEFGEVVSYQWDWGNDGTIDATTPQFVMTNSEIVGGHACKVTVTDDDGNVGEFVSGVTSQLVWEKVGELSGIQPDKYPNFGRVFSLNDEFLYQDVDGYFWKSLDGIDWERCTSKKAFKPQRIVKYLGKYYALESIENFESYIYNVTIRSSKNLEEWNVISKFQNLKIVDSHFGGSFPERGIYFNIVNGRLTINIADTLNGKSSNNASGYLRGPLYILNEAEEWIRTENELNSNLKCCFVTTSDLVYEFSYAGINDSTTVFQKEFDFNFNLKDERKYKLDFNVNAETGTSGPWGVEEMQGYSFNEGCLNVVSYHIGYYNERKYVTLNRMDDCSFRNTAVYKDKVYMVTAGGVFKTK